jgi:hypothetical protein
VTSLKAYRVEFIEPLTEYPETENEKVGTTKCDQARRRILITGTEPWATGVNPDEDDGDKSSQ